MKKIIPTTETKLKRKRAVGNGEIPVNGNFINNSNLILLSFCIALDNFYRVLP